jgi:hypothetical protein
MPAIAALLKPEPVKRHLTCLRKDPAALPLHDHAASQGCAALPGEHRRERGTSKGDPGARLPATVAGHGRAPARLPGRPRRAILAAMPRPGLRPPELHATRPAILLEPSRSLEGILQDMTFGALALLSLGGFLTAVAVLAVMGAVLLLPALFTAVAAGAGGLVLTHVETFTHLERWRGRSSGGGPGQIHRGTLSPWCCQGVFSMRSKKLTGPNGCLDLLRVSRPGARQGHPCPQPISKPMIPPVELLEAALDAQNHRKTTGAQGPRRALAPSTPHRAPCTSQLHRALNIPC